MIFRNLNFPFIIEVQTLSLKFKNNENIVLSDLINTIQTCNYSATKSVFYKF